MHAFKGTVSRVVYFLRSKHSNTVCSFFECSDGFLGLWKASPPYNISFLASFKLPYFLNLMLTEILLRIPFSVIGQCSLVPPSHWLQGKCARIYMPQVASCIILQNSRLPVSIFSVKIGLLEWFSKFKSNIKGSSWNFEFDFSSTY